MELEFLSLTRSEKNLEKLDEYWESSSYEDKFFSISREFYKKKKYTPLGNMKLFRVLSFYIKASITMENIRLLCNVIRAKYQIECFQISIDREDNRVYLQFVWLNEEYDSIILTPFDWKKITVLIIRYLNLPRPASTKPLVKYYLKDAYEHDQEIFNKQLEVLFQAKVKGLNYGLIQDALQYAEGMCRGELK